MQLNYRHNKNRSNKRYFNKSRSNKMFLNKFLNFARVFINYHSITLLIAVSIYCCFIKYQAKPLLPCYYTISNLKDTRYLKYIRKWKLMTNYNKLILNIVRVIILMTKLKMKILILIAL